MEIIANVLVLPLAEAASLGGLRLSEGIEVAEFADFLWLKVAPEAGEDALKKIPAMERRVLSSDGKLYVAGRTLPEGRLPSTLQWTSLKEWIRVEPPKAALPARSEKKADLRLEPGGRPKEAGALLVELAAFEKHVAISSELRLANWKFAVSGKGRVLVLGSPVPSIAGSQFSVEAGIAVPLGWQWTPRVSAPVVAKLFKLQRGDLVLWESNERCTKIHGEQWLPVSRGAVRASLEGLE